MDIIDLIGDVELSDHEMELIKLVVIDFNKIIEMRPDLLSLDKSMLRLLFGFYLKGCSRGDI